VHAPFTPGAIGEIIVDSLPTGSLFSFLWNMLISVSFQFVGFLLTYLMHTTHAARLGSRAGLGVTLIQYGYALSGPGRGSEGDMGGWPEVGPSQPTSSESRISFRNTITNRQNSTSVSNQFTEANGQVIDPSTEWLSYFLMIVGEYFLALAPSTQTESELFPGWFLLITSFLGFWRVKRWEQSILASQRDHSRTSPEPSSTLTALSRVEQAFALRGVSRIDLLRQGFGLDNSSRLAEEGSLVRGDGEHVRESDLMIPMDPSNPERSQRLAQVLEHDRRLQMDLRNAGLL